MANAHEKYGADPWRDFGDWGSGSAAKGAGSAWNSVSIDMSQYTGLILRIKPGDTFTAIGIGTPLACQISPCRAASLRMFSPRAPIDPPCSAIGTNTDGETRRSPWRQRTSASAPTSSPETSSTWGWKWSNR